MSRTTAPLLSFDARGQIGKTQVYSSWKGRSYARRYVIPSNPDTIAQQSTRNAWRTLNSIFQFMAEAAQETWNLAANAQQMTGRNLFLKRNLSAFRGATDYEGVDFATAAAGGFPPAAMTVTPGNDQLTVALTAPSVPTGWTVVAAHVVVLPNTDPTAVAPGTMSYATDLTAAYSVTITGLISAQEYVVAGWFEYTKPDGKTAFGSATVGTGLTT